MNRNKPILSAVNGERETVEADLKPNVVQAAQKSRYFRYPYPACHRLRFTVYCSSRFTVIHYLREAVGFQAGAPNECPVDVLLGHQRANVIRLYRTTVKYS
ncbi:MAG: hypothetical protein JWM21_3894 [Acidobacteria bacterium]|nr:hypothetical protein [Acidobacteriota bacterium]